MVESLLLACYVCQQGRLKEARVMIGRALELDSKLKQLVLDSPDLEALRSRGWTGCDFPA